MWIGHGRGARPLYRRANGVEAEIAGFGGRPRLMRIAAHHHADSKAVGVERLEFLKPARRDVGGKIQSRDPMLTGRAIDLEGAEVAVACQQRSSFAHELTEI